MGLFDRSSSSSTTTYQTDNSQVGQSNVSGVAVGQVGGNVTVLDGGAVAGALELARESLAAGVESVYAGHRGLEEVAGLAGEVVRSNERTTLEAGYLLSDSLDRSLQFGDRIVTEALDASRSSAGIVADQARDVLGFAGDTVADYALLAERSAASQASLLDRFISTITGITGQALDDADARSAQFVGAVSDTFARESSNTDARLESITKYALIGGAIVAGLALWSAMK